MCPTSIHTPRRWVYDWIMHCEVSVKSPHGALPRTPVWGPKNDLTFTFMDTCVYN